MKLHIKKAFKTLIGKDVLKNTIPSDFESFHLEIIKKVAPYTMTSNERLFGLIEAVKYIVKNNISGSFVECGVWKGGSMMAIAETLIKLGVNDRELYLYDTFEGMTAPTEADESHNSEKALSLLDRDKKNKQASVVWAYSSIEEVKRNIETIKYPAQNIHFIQGDVLKTIPHKIPSSIALLRLDTDWYESTKHELEHLYPLLMNKGVLIIDDYGFWKGSRKAVDEYFKNIKQPVLLNRMDDTGRIAIKLV